MTKVNQNVAYATTPPPLRIAFMNPRKVLPMLAPDGFSNITQIQHSSLEPNNLDWFTARIGQKVFGSAMKGSYGLVTINDEDHGRTLFSSQSHGFRFINMQDRLSLLAAAKDLPFVQTLEFADYKALYESECQQHGTDKISADPFWGLVVTLSNSIA